MKASIVTIVLLAGGFAPAVDAVERLGGNFRISFQQGTGDPAFGARRPAVAYNSRDGEYLVVWEGAFRPPFPECPFSSPIQREIFAQRLSATSGALLDTVTIVSQSGPACNGDHQASRPAVAYNADANEYLVAWQADGDSGGQADNEFEIFVRRLDAAGNLLGAGQMRISDLGGLGDAAFDATDPAVAWNGLLDRYLVVWVGDDGEGNLVDNEFEIWGQFLNAFGEEIGDNDFRISTMGIEGRTDYTAAAPAVAWNSTLGQYLVVWEGSDRSPGAGELEIFGHRISSQGDLVGADDFRISFQQGSGDRTFGAREPALAYHPEAREYLVVWDGDFRRPGPECPQTPPAEREIFGQRLDGSLTTPVGPAFAISQSGPVCDATHKASSPAAAFDAASGDYVVVWYGDDDVGGLANDEFEIFGRSVDRNGVPLGARGMRLSEMGGTGDPSFDAVLPAVADRVPVVVWHGDDNTGGLVNNELEVFGQLLGGVIFADGFE